LYIEKIWTYRCFIAGDKVVKTIKSIIGIVVLGLGLAGVAPAAFTVPSTGYLGYLGDVEIGYSGGLIGTHAVDSGSGFLPNQNAYLTTQAPLNDGFRDVAAPHWYKFDVSQTLNIGGFLELGSHVDEITISFYNSLDDAYDFQLKAAYTGSRHDYPVIGTFGADTWWMKVEGISGGVDDSYTMKLEASPVPLPPAVLLFGSAIAGFGALGRRKRRQHS
jgi:hypothetical protein